ncbi:hypothetical protein ES703_19877 [subsurface metagenome]
MIIESSHTTPGVDILREELKELTINRQDTLLER